MKWMKVQALGSETPGFEPHLPLRLVGLEASDLNSQNLFPHILINKNNTTTSFRVLVRTK